MFHVVQNTDMRPSAVDRRAGRAEGALDGLEGGAGTVLPPAVCALGGTNRGAVTGGHVLSVAPFGAPPNSDAGAGVSELGSRASAAGALAAAAAGCTRRKLKGASSKWMLCCRAAIHDALSSARSACIRKDVPAAKLVSTKMWLRGPMAGASDIEQPFNFHVPLGAASPALRNMHRVLRCRDLQDLANYERQGTHCA